MPDGGTLTIHLLGGFRITSGDQGVTALEHARLQDLPAYLLLQRGRPVSRQQLAFLFWPDSGEKQARTNLRSLWHRLRRAPLEQIHSADLGRAAGIIAGHYERAHLPAQAIAARGMTPKWRRLPAERSPWPRLRGCSTTSARARPASPGHTLSIALARVMAADRRRLAQDRSADAIAYARQLYDPGQQVVPPTTSAMGRG